MRFLASLTSSLSLFVLTACELPSKLGDLPTGGDTDDLPGTGTDTGGATTNTTGDDPKTTGNEPDTSTGEPDTTTTTTGMTSGAESTSEGGGCDGLDEPACVADPACQAYHGVPYEFEGCQPGDAYLGCGPALACDQAFSTACRDGTDEVYLIPTTCVPPGFSACDAPGQIPCGQTCDVMDEAACAFDGDFCEPIHGLPHVMQEGSVCVDQTPVFLACVVMDGVCPPFVPTVCHTGNSDEKYDIPSGCIPPQYEECEGAGTPACK